MDEGVAGGHGRGGFVGADGRFGARCSAQPGQRPKCGALKRFIEKRLGSASRHGWSWPRGGQRRMPFVGPVARRITVALRLRCTRRATAARTGQARTAARFLRRAALRPSPSARATRRHLSSRSAPRAATRALGAPSGAAQHLAQQRSFRHCRARARARANASASAQACMAAPLTTSSSLCHIPPLFLGHARRPCSSAPFPPSTVQLKARVNPPRWLLPRHLWCSSPPAPTAAHAARHRSLC